MEEIAMIAIRNLEKFFEDHPELADRKDAILAAAREKAEKGSEVLTGGAADEILGGLAPDFFREVQSNNEHVEIGVEAVKKFARR